MINENQFERLYKLKNFEMLFELFLTDESFETDLFDFLNCLIKTPDTIDKHILSETVFSKFNREFDKFIINIDSPESNEYILGEFIFNLIIFINERKYHPRSLDLLTIILNIIKSFKKSDIIIINDKLRYEAKVYFPRILNPYFEIFIDIFDIYKILKNDYIVNYSNGLILSGKKFDILLKYITYFDIKNDVNYNNLIDKCIQDKSKFKIINQICKIYPDKLEYIIRFFLDINDTKHAMIVAKSNKSIIDENLFELIQKQAKMKELNYHLMSYMKWEVDMERLYELYDDNSEMLSLLCNELCKRNLFQECYYILKCRNFSDISIGTEEGNNLKEYLMYNFNLKLIKVSNDMQFYSQYKNIKKLNLYFEDYFGPFNYDCITIPLMKEKILFISEESQLINLDIFQNSEHIGIDLEWRCNSETDNSFASIMQLADEETVTIIDYGKLKDNICFSDKFITTFKYKKFISFGFSSDIKKLKGDIQKFMSKTEMIDLTYLYKNKFNKVCPSLSELCKQFLNSNLCKYEQMSNWEKRPLRMRQLHYAAMDAYILLKLFKLF